MTEKFDILVIGSGPAGSNLAGLTSGKGLKTAIVESRAYGGTCPLRGCNPKKVLASAAKMIAEAENMQGTGISGNSHINWKDLITFKQSFVDPIPEAKEKSLQKKGVITFHGEAKFISDNQVKIADQTTIEADKIIIATGAVPAELPIKGKEHLVISDDFLNLTELPKDIIFIGGGYIAFEFAHIAKRASSNVHIIQRGQHPLRKFDPDLVDKLIAQSKSIGIQVHLEADVKAIEKDGQKYSVVAEQNGSKVSWESDMVVHGGGRVPNVADLGLEEANVAYDKQGIKVDNYLRSPSNPHVYAIGDAAASEGAPLTPVAQQDAQIVFKNIGKENSVRPDYTGVPSVVFTTPKLASAGLSVAAAQKLDKETEIHDLDISRWFTYAHVNSEFAAVKVIMEKDTQKILGAHMLGDSADELINIFAMAIQLRLTADQLKGVTYAFPTAVSDIGSML
ncbi:dihydrolipoyl dehydrogenase family protein [Virgibacillus halophilus]|uniref:NAD(P)/FAD-dependent oxidoreductase n=1 Tax=Tigheibacillus halophilus TaxID=361280 RepID=A0ABU5CB25_9BACI|nr:NAD(P)/FAD-dependent oxidoreductase [Virgibacillus halophilus]